MERLAQAPLPVPEFDRVAWLGLDEVRALADSRVGARVTIDNPLLHSHGPATPGANLQADSTCLISEEQDGRWLIDGCIE